jgi:hypothetical protein
MCPSFNSRLAPASILVVSKTNCLTARSHAHCSQQTKLIKHRRYHWLRTSPPGLVVLFRFSQERRPSKPCHPTLHPYIEVNNVHPDALRSSSRPLTSSVLVKSWTYSPVREADQRNGKQAAACPQSNDFLRGRYNNCQSCEATL